MIRPSIRWRLTLWYGAALAAILLLFSVATFWRYRAAAWKAFDVDLVQNLDTLQAELGEELGEARAGNAPEEGSAAGIPSAEVRRRAAASTLDEFRLTGLSAEIRGGPRADIRLARLAADGADTAAPILPDPIWNEVAATPGTRIVRFGSSRAATRSFRPPAEAEPITLAVAESTAAVERTLASIRRDLLLFGLGGLLLALAGGSLLAARALRPIDAMTIQASRMASALSSEPRRLDVSRPDDELGRLAETFNRLLERIESSVFQVRRFVADAAHELKTPVSVVRAEAELSLSSDRGLESDRDALRAIARQSEELSRLVSDLTLLAEGETLEHPLERRLVDLREIAEDVARSQRALAAGRGIAVEVKSSGSAEYRGDERLLRQVVRNLLENALKFSRSPGRVGLSISEGPGAIELSVRDEAPALAPEERERVFERFYRAPQARRGDAPGSGLGLAIVQWAVKLHGGEVRVEPGESGRGNVFVVTFPRAAEPPSLSDLPERPAGVRLSARPRGA